MNTKANGDIAVANAVAKYVGLGYEVLLPMGDKKPYDLVIDTGLELLKVQVKYAGLTADGSFRAELRTRGGNQSFKTEKRYDEGDFDLLFIWTAGSVGYSIPWDELPARTAVTIGGSGKFDQFVI